MIIYKYLKDKFLHLCECYGSSINSWAWRKRWGKRHWEQKK
jgi:hypothetical protein